jgi:HPt (histidine-containing phosphotransfer) domain-containing protein
MIDWNQVKQLEEDIGAEDFSDIVEVFIEEVDEAVNALRDVSAISDSDLASALHFLKGSASNLGYQDFAECCGNGEKLAETGCGADVDIQKIISLYDQSKLAFLKGASSHTSYVS